ncbi:MAG: hypothetical protein QNJ84_19095 [Alphaproteobacteria bacterium]|nr:hypothetical protein [Alphaproteobacteria bacterium]
MNDKKPTVPAFSFDEMDEEEDRAQRRRRDDEKARNRDAFRRANYVPPEERDTSQLAIATNAKSVSGATKSQSRKSLAPQKPTFLKRRQGRPAGDRTLKFSVKTTERHLEVLYEIAGNGELVGAFEDAIEALAREVFSSGEYRGRKVERDVITKAKNLINGG